MSQEHLSKLSFSIEESVWLNKGQEVKEILSMSLEPEISIEEQDQHVYIRGGLRLLGEYLSEEQDKEVNLNDSLEEQLSFRSVEEVTLNGNGTGEIKHFFPIDVTIPMNRIQKLDDVYVQVDSFDYDLPEKSCIQLTADISISGMSQTELNTEAHNQHQEAEVEQQAPVLETIPTAFSFEAKKQAERETVPPSSSYREVRMEDGPNEPLHEEKQFEVEQPEEHVAIPPVQQQKSENERPEVELSTEVTASEDIEEVEREEEVEAQQEQVEDEPEVESIRQEVETKINLSPLKEMATQPEQPVYEEDEEEREPEAEEKKLAPKEENALYLTKMLSREEEKFLKWKMCIIQENESLDQIAERYEVSTTQLVRINRLEREQVEEGQILYIPVTSQS
ncbi:stage VI sporulation protein D [Halalkalibacter urbisdiaboli]|uniref:stage VI sporulation protein D n=1 Tax=Halalkalibacter urbisdiaboli TaxID=1960589 RepID=UPI000B444BEE|nr:stage VI sporulation protein D [Halalkalibacter urbisdiaboli]